MTIEGHKNTQTNPRIKRQQPFCMLRYLAYFYTKPLLTLIRYFLPHHFYITPLLAPHLVRLL
ncbi:hypothetical protein [Helicobacter pylori]|uniref:hypothetical protein n=1 Tax=Helicobacter pylori TaxID=210 RepID=UPI002FBF18B2